VTELQTADLIAYETFRLLHGEQDGVLTARKSLESMFPKNGFKGLYYGRQTLEKMKPANRGCSELRAKWLHYQFCRGLKSINLCDSSGP